jgi:hypothetical protein
MTKQSISSGDNSVNVITDQNVNLYLRGYVPTEFVDQKIKEEVEKLRKSRFFSEFDRSGAPLILGTRLAEGDLSGGSNGVKGPALAWCARLLSRSENFDKAEKFIEDSKSLGAFTEAKIAEAFIISQKGNKAAALKALAEIDSGSSHSAGLMIVAFHDGVDGALRWMNEAGYTAGNLDSDGKSVLLSYQLTVGRWDEVTQTVGMLSKADFDETPILHHWVALATLVSSVPQEFRAAVLAQAPFDAAYFRLASDAVAMDARRAAHQYFLNATKAAEQLACQHAAKVDDEYALWLELRDPAQRAHGKNRLEDKLSNPKTRLGFVNLALQFGIKLDLSLVERDINQNIAKNGGMTIDAAFARYALAFTQQTPEEVANYISRHYDQLSIYLNTKLLQFHQIEFLSRSGLIERANEVLDRLLKEGIPPEQESNLRRIISEAQGSDPVESRKAQYETTRALIDLMNLVTELEDHQRWDDLCEFGRRLFEETRSLIDAERLVNAFNNTHRSEALVRFIRENPYFLPQSNLLCISYAWGLYDEGAFLECRDVLTEFRDMLDGPNYRALRVDLGISTGDWASLSAYIAEEYRKRGDRSARHLIDTAQLALYLGLPHQAKDLVFEAAAKADNDSAILANAYLIATNAGWENDLKIFKWLEKASELSGDDGPLQKMSLKDVLNLKPDWDRRESETWRLLAQGQIPIFFAAQSLNRTLMDLTTFPALANLTETDPRRRSIIPAYSGKRMPLAPDVGGKTVALEATAVLTLSFLKILDVALDAFETVYIPHSTLGWLFKERQKAAFHQPSRIVNAHKVRDLVATGLLERFTPNTTASSDLSVQIGDELAALIAEAERVPNDDERRHIVVRSAPVHRLSSLMEEEADLSAHVAVLSSCSAVVEKLRQKGQLTADEEKRARAYLQLHEKPWPNQPDIADGAILYLDDIAVTYFLHLGFLEKLKPAGLRAVISPREISETDALISYEGISNDVRGGIESIRASLNSRIESGRVRVSRRRIHNEVEEELISEHPSVSIFALAPLCDIAIIDDRFLNQHANIDSGGAQMPVFSTLDLLDAMVASGVLSDDDRLEHRTMLRRAGYFFVPISVVELERCLKESTVAKGKMVERAELKAIRESVLRVRMSDWLQLPEEVAWLHGTLTAFIHVLRNLWVDGADIEEITARSNWLIEQIDIRGWAHSLVPENADYVVRIGRATHILSLLTSLPDVEKSVADAYWNWVEEKILAPIQEQFPEVYKWLVDWNRNYMAEMSKRLSSGGANS